MALFSFFKPYKPREFHYTPRHYDPDKERREQRRRELALERGEGGGIHEAFAARRAEIRRGRQKSNRRLALIITVLVFLVWWMFH